MDEYKLIEELVRRHNAGLIDLDRDETDKLAQKAYEHGIEFNVEAKPVRKALFDAADMAMFGMLPNKWRPYSGGQDLYGERGIDRVAGGLGSLAGLAGGVFGAVKAAPAVVGSFRSGNAAAALSMVKKTEAGKRATNIANSIYNGGKNIVGSAVDRMPSRVGETASTAAEWWSRDPGVARLGRILTGAERLNRRTP